VEKILKEKNRRELRGLKVAVFGATGVVGFSAGVIAALEGADVTLVGYDGPARVSAAAKDIKARFDVDVHAADGSDDAKKSAILAQAEAALCAGRAGVRILSTAQLAAAPHLLVVADVNAVPPSGVEGLEMTANGAELTPHGTFGIGPLAVGNVKYQTESGLFRRMIAAEKAVRFDFRDAFQFARELHG
jgi:methylene-tetrahydromethanopterin dehydrogenase